MSEDALERLRNRQRPEVPARDLALTSRSDSPEKLEVPSSVDTSMSRNLQVSIAQNLESKKTINQASKYAEDFKTKQSTLRLEAEISDRLQKACRAHDLSREVLIEALFLHCEADPQAWQSVLNEAKVRAEHRQQLANQRRAHSMMQRFGESL